MSKVMQTNSMHEALVLTSAQHSAAQRSTAQRSTAQHSTAQHSTAQHSTAQHSTAQLDIAFAASHISMLLFLNNYNFIS
jgi:type I restriction enzyme M protein